MCSRRGRYAPASLIRILGDVEIGKAAELLAVRSGCKMVEGTTYLYGGLRCSAHLDLARMFLEERRIDEARKARRG